jgi:hypothetical protein
MAAALLRGARSAAAESTRSFKNTEEFIENLYPVDITCSVTIDCKVTLAWNRQSRHCQNDQPRPTPER